jgi:hypothetical protein
MSVVPSRVNELPAQLVYVSPEPLPAFEAGLVTPLLDHYARWYGFSAIWQALAFLASAAALAAR